MPLNGRNLLTLGVNRTAITLRCNDPNHNWFIPRFLLEQTLCISFLLNTLKLHLFNYVVIELDVVSLVKTLFHLIWSLCERFRALASQTENCCSGPDQRMARQRSCINFTEIAFNQYKSNTIAFMSRQNRDIDVCYSSLPLLLSSMGTLQADRETDTQTHRGQITAYVLFCYFESFPVHSPQKQGGKDALFSDLYFTGVKQESCH